ncbi:MAG: inositol monophosphatase family protein [bacterium]
MLEYELRIGGEIVEKCSKIIARRFAQFSKTSEISCKDEENMEIVTPVDREIEEIIVESLRKEFPEYGVWGEEFGKQEGTSEFFWLIDPLDGTKNFTRNIPFFALCLALVNSEYPLIGIVSDPLRRETFWAVKGMGSYRNKRKIRVSQKNTVEGAVFACGIPYRARKDILLFEEIFRQLYLRGAGVRKTGCTALEICYTAMGKFDGFYVFSQAPWDFAAGWIILEEAGGKLTTLRGRKPVWDYQYLCGGNPSLHEVLKNLFSASSFSLSLPE